ncbi:MAG: phosphatase PAP2 family protein [Metallibacterium sp.]
MGMHAWWWRITALGDSAVLLPIALLLAAWLLLRAGTRATGWWWLGVLCVDVGVVALSKLLYMGWGLHPPGLDFVGLCGHCALSFLIWPVLAALLAAPARRRWRIVAALLGALLALGVTVSRLTLDAHSPSEAVLGTLWGALLAALFLWHERRPGRLQQAGGWMALGLLLPLLLTYGRAFPSNRILEVIARRVSGHTRIYTRCDLPRDLRGDACAPPRVGMRKH